MSEHGPKVAQVTLVALPPGPNRQAALGVFIDALPASAVLAVILEGADAPAPAASRDSTPFGRPVVLHVLAPGCPCCIGSLALRVTLTRILRLEQPTHIFIAIADRDHLPSLRQVLAQPPFSGYLEVAEVNPLRPMSLESGA